MASQGKVVGGVVVLGGVVLGRACPVVYAKIKHRSALRSWQQYMQVCVARVCASLRKRCMRDVPETSGAEDSHQYLRLLRSPSPSPAPPVEPLIPLPPRPQR